MAITYFITNVIERLWVEIWFCTSEAYLEIKFGTINCMSFRFTKTVIVLLLFILLSLTDVKLKQILNTKPAFLWLYDFHVNKLSKYITTILHLDWKSNKNLGRKEYYKKKWTTSTMKKSINSKKKFQNVAGVVLIWQAYYLICMQGPNAFGLTRVLKVFLLINRLLICPEVKEIIKPNIHISMRCWHQCVCVCYGEERLGRRSGLSIFPFTFSFVVEGLVPLLLWSIGRLVLLVCAAKKSRTTI